MNTTYFNSVNRYSYVYSVKPGDTLTRIIWKFYHFKFETDGYNFALAQIKKDNPKISDPNSIKSGQSIYLRKLSSSDAKQSEFFSKTIISDHDQAQFESTMKSMSQNEKEAFWALSWLDDNWGPASVGIGATFASMGALLGDSDKGNVAELKKLDGLYRDYKSGAFSKGQYDYRRKKLLENVAKNLGPTEKLLFNGKKAREAMRISRNGGVMTTAALQKNTERLAKLSKVAAKGGTVLTAVNIGIACDQIARADSNVKKNEILVETAASTVVGTVSGIAISLFVVATPVGWVGALVLGVASSVGGYYSGKQAAAVYKEHYSHLDVVKSTGVGNICSY
ncbi:TPA: LysM peptidoglycan-binding domain-containing protein [Vibrio parahaemolyticus]|nr:LysM peptidoglycan-binding domain-containing protein [Vibrio parahaemolyticus]HCG8454609.1 LysM peptidoglycan-binding domain-containing protein [Vibrio parahaemolyticus]